MRIDYGRHQFGNRSGAFQRGQARRLGAATETGRGPVRRARLFL
jgi:hypothetical protein